MKQINSIFRTLCLAALLCMSSVSAMAYDLIQTEEIETLLTDGEQHISAIGGNVRIGSLYVGDGDAAIILPGAEVNVYSVYDNHGTVYVFGKLDISQTHGCDNFGPIYLIGNCTFKGSFTEELQIQPECKDASEVLNRTTKYEGRPVTETQHGLRDYWEKGIEFNGDYCPIFYYTDEACTNKISNIEEWRNNGRIIYSIPLYRKEAIEAIDNEINGMTILTEEDMQMIEAYKVIINIETDIERIDNAKNTVLEYIYPKKVKETALAAIRSAMQGETSAYLTGLVQAHINIIYNSDDESEIENAKNAAVVILNDIIDTYKAIKADVLGTMGTEQEGPMIEVKGKDGNTIKLYKIENVKFGKAETK